ncbi:hypothetical protein EHS25_003043 [Saitozyma podzolica]|uniref:Uncharacterized protein n=1 Tax=Saitozyma podzolica TaxID=1890683 RepID=A0A427YCE9_9TREE|nr:hypothetical protein EHS25_003043 [Saitozyma podzolica]
MSELFKDIPEFVETNISESIAARTDTLATFRELGPPDLCQVVKSSGSKTAQKEIGSYHYCSGVEASSSASLAAYLNSLQFSIEDSSAWFGKGNGWRVRSGVYCCFNAFSRVDMRVDVRIPGGVDAYAIDLRGEKHEATAELWQETYLSALLRAIRYADDASYRLAGYRKLDPITTPEAEIRFLQTAEELFFKGWQLGSDPEIQVATAVTNHLTAAIMKYFSDAFRLERAANLFERLAVKEPEVASLLARSYIGMNEEIKAVKILNSALEANPLSYPTLHAQCDFLLSKGKADWARHVAQQAVNAAPSEFVTWAKLTETYIELEQYDRALLTLNSCPMFTFNERDLHRMPQPARTHLPVKKFIAESNILDDESARDNETRSAVFVMEEEYRLHKNTTNELDATDDASTTAIRSPAEPSTQPNTPSDIPTIRISSESDRVRPNGKHEPVLEKPELAQANENPGSPMPMTANGEEVVSAFSNKRLCERWLDNLFLKSGTEWEILGELALRLHHKEEAKDAFQRCLDAKFSAKALLKLLEIWYMDSAYPSMVAHYLYKLGLVHGHAKIQYTLLSMNLPVGIFEIMQGYMKYAQTFNVEGSEF